MVEEGLRQRHSDSFRAAKWPGSGKRYRREQKDVANSDIIIRGIYLEETISRGSSGNIFRTRPRGDEIGRDYDDPLLREIGRLQVENAYLKKKCMI